MMEDTQLFWKYFGKPWEAGKKGPNSYSCWGLIQAIYLNDLGIELPDFEVKDWQNINQFFEVFETQTESKENWFQVPEARQFDVVLLGRSRHPCHAGIWAGQSGQARGRIVHALQPGLASRTGGIGVVAQSMPLMRLHGWNFMQFYRNKQLAEKQNGPL